MSNKEWYDASIMLVRFLVWLAMWTTFAAWMHSWPAGVFVGLLVVMWFWKE